MKGWIVGCLMGGALLIAILLSTSSASAAPFTPSTDFYSVSGSQLYGGSVPAGDTQPIGASYATAYNALGYNQQDNYLYVLAGDAPTELLRIHSDGDVDNLGTVTGLPDGVYAKGAFDEEGRLWVHPNGTSTLYGIDVATQTVTSSYSPALPTSLFQDVAYHAGEILLLTVDVGDQHFIGVNVTTGAVTEYNHIPSPTGTGILAGVSMWSTHQGRIFLYITATPGGAPNLGIWEVVDPFGAEPTFVKRADQDAISAQGDGASNYLADSPWEITATR